MDFSAIVEAVGKGVDAGGVALIVIGALIATGRFVFHLVRRANGEASYRRYRQGLGRTLLLGLEFLVAADIIRTVAIAPSFTNLGLLAVIVLIRTFLSWSLELEIEGHWPWQKRQEAPASPGAPTEQL